MSNVIIANQELIEKAKSFLEENNFFHEFCKFHRDMFPTFISKGCNHSDRWSAIYDWVELKASTTDVEIVTALTEYYETFMIHIKRED